MEQIPAALKIIDLVRSISRTLKRPLDWLRLLVFRLGNRLKPSMDRDTAMAIAFATLGGSVIAAIPYRDLGNPHRLIGAIRKPHDKTWVHRIYILEQFGQSWRVKWESEDLYEHLNLKAFSLHDVDNDGMSEISFAFSSFGTGGGGETVYLHVPAKEQTYPASIGRFWADPTSPPMAEIRVHPAGKAEQVYMRAIETICDQLGLTAPVPRVDLDDPRYAVLRWHKENGQITHGEVKIHLYEGTPFDQSTIVAEIEDGDLVWTSHFKNAVYGYIRSQDKHFVVYSPSIAWSWAGCLLATANYLWIGTRGDRLLRFDKDKHFLFQFKQIQGNELHEVRSFEKEGDFFIINGKLRVPAVLLEEEWPGMDEILRRFGGGEPPPTL